jgi:hypothetical protein
MVETEPISQEQPFALPHLRFRPGDDSSIPNPENRVSMMIQGILLFVGITAAYLANGRYVGSGDCVPAMYLPIALARGDGLWLDRFEHFLTGADGRLPGYCEKSRGHVVSRYPVGSGLIIAPLVIPQVWIHDLIEPDWEKSPERTRQLARRMSKNASALLASTAMVTLWIWLRSIYAVSAATIGTLAAAFGTGMWSTAAQAPWQHGPAVFCLCMVLCILRFGRDELLFGILAGSFAALIVVCRTVDLPIAAALCLYVMRRRPAMRLGFIVSAAMVAVMWSSWNVYFFDHMTGGYAEIEKMHGWAHGIKGSWSTPLAAGLAGTFLSPSHGLIVYSPWVLTILAAPFVLRRCMDPDIRRIAVVLSLSLIPTTVILAKYGCWWAGHCFGPRFWIDSTPIFALFAAGCWAYCSEFSGRARNAVRAALTLGFIWAAGLQAVAVSTYPSTWHSTSTNADRDHGRLWDFRDNEVTRGWKEGSHPREWPAWF